MESFIVRIVALVVYMQCINHPCEIRNETLHALHTNNVSKTSNKFLLNYQIYIPSILIASLYGYIKRIMCKLFLTCNIFWRQNFLSTIHLVLSFDEEKSYISLGSSIILPHYIFSKFIWVTITWKITQNCCHTITSVSIVNITLDRYYIDVAPIYSSARTADSTLNSHHEIQ